MLSPIDLHYCTLVNNICNNGYDHDNTIMLPMQTIKADNIIENFPIVQHKKLFINGVWKELLFFLHGFTDVRILQEQGVHIWDANADPQYKIDHNKHLADHELGPIYGYQWRNFNSQGYDQLKYIIDQLLSHSLSRRLFMSAWNPAQLDEMVLPPCHVSYHFIPYVKNGIYTVDLMMYQRSADVMLGLPFNIASCAFLLLIICKYCSVNPGSVCICIGNAHIYKKHLENVEGMNQVKQFQLDYFIPATVTIDGDITGSFDNFINTVTYKLNNYSTNNRIKFDIVV